MDLIELKLQRRIEAVLEYFPGGTSLQRWHRDLLRRAMESEGFTVNEDEWWHFDYKDWKFYSILNVRFEDLHAASPAGVF